MGKSKSRRTVNYKLKTKRQKRLSHAKSRLRSALGKTTSDFHREKEEKEEQIKSLRKKNDKLKYQLKVSRNDHVMKPLGTVTCTRGTTACTREITMTLPTQVRKITWLSKWSNDEKACLGKGVFGKCYLVQIGPISACLKVFRSERKYSNTFFNEVRMLMQLNHNNIPWLYGVVNTGPRAIAMSYHSFYGGNESATVHNTLSKLYEKVAYNDWKVILMGGIAAIDYLCNRKIIHNDIKGDNMLIEYLPPDYKSCRSILIDFGKACYISEAMLYNLSVEQKEFYKKNHPQIAPEVRNGLEMQSYCSDIYSYGRIFQQINEEMLKIPVLYKMAEQCLDYCSKMRPTAGDLHKFLVNLFQ